MKRISILLCFVAFMATACGGVGNFSAQRFQDEPVHFDTARYDLRPDAKNILDEKIAFLKHYPGAEVFLVGHADVRSDDKFNMNLGFLRAEEVYRYFVENGISSHRIRIMTDGKRYPKVAGRSNSDLLADRRVEFFLSTVPSQTTTP